MNIFGYSVRKAAEIRIRVISAKPEELVKIAKNDKDQDIRKAAVEILEDQEVLAWIAKYDESSMVRESSYDRIKELKRK